MLATKARKSLGRCAIIEAATTIEASLPKTQKAIREQIDQAADLLADAMRRLHGGTWSARVDHKLGFVLISPLPARSAASERRKSACGRGLADFRPYA